MAECPLPFTIWRRHAFAALNEYFQSRTPSARSLSAFELSQHQSVSAEGGWRTSIEVNGQTSEIDIIIDRHYPFSLPGLFLVGQNRFLVWPHVEKSGKLCLLPEHSTFAISTDVRLIEHLLDDAKALIGQCLDGSNRSDFATEFLSYWGADIDDNRATRYWSVLKPTGPTREIFYWKGTQFVLLAESLAQGKEWLQNFLGEVSGSSFQFCSGILMWLPAPLYPDQYPHNNSNLRGLAQTLGESSIRILAKVIMSSQEGFPVAFGFETEQGPVLAGLWSSPPMHSIPHRKSNQQLIKGFRPGKVPPELLANRYLISTGALEKRKVQRCDRAWVHARGGDGAAVKFSHKSVMLIGCGSLGAQIGELLVQGGVGRVILIDHDNLAWDNVGRHIIGGTGYVGTNKAEALGKNLQRRFPYLDVVTRHSRWQEIYENDQKLFLNCNVIASTTGDWASDAALNLLTRCSLKFPPIVFGWSEAYACAGHALAVLDIGGCLACGMNELGQFQISPIAWEPVPEPHREPGCGGSYQQFGSIATNPINAVIASTVVDVLQGSFGRSHHRVWISHSDVVASRGGHWNPKWPPEYGEIGSGERIFRFDWPIATTCQLCQG